MKILNVFPGMVLRKNDVDFNSYGAREAITRLNIDITSAQGGIINGLNVFSSIDGLSILVQPGTFYSAGSFSANNNQGGGERAQVYTTQSFTGLPSTAPISNQPSYLVVYAKIANQNSNPDPTQLQTTTTSVNIQTGQNVPTQNYPVGTIAISNPVLANQIGSFNGVTLAVLQVDYVGVTQVSSNGTIQSIDTSKAQDYIIGGAVDVAEQQIIPSAVPNGFITNRMIGSGQVTGYNFATGTINSAAIAPWDGSIDLATTGNGIATAHIKGGAITAATINYTGSLNTFSERNYVLNSSFELNATYPPNNWTFTGATGTSASIVAGSQTAWDGNNALLLTGGASGSPAVSKTLSISQNIAFTGPVNGRDITAFFYINPLNNFNGTDSINGTLTFYNNITDANNQVNAISTQVFAGYSGISTGDYIQVQTTGVISIPTTSNSASVINVAIGGTFNNTVYVDAVYLGLTSITPQFDVAVGEQVGTAINANNITQGLMNGSFITPGTVTPNLIPLAAGGVTYNTNGGILGTQIASGTITASNIANNTITNAQLAAGIAAVPLGAAFIMLPLTVNGVSIFTTNLIANPGQYGCPVGTTYVGQMAGMMPVGINPLSSVAQFATPGSTFGTPLNATSSSSATITTAGHSHVVDYANLASESAGSFRYDTANTDSSTDTIQPPFVTVLWCQKTS